MLSLEVEIDKEYREGETVPAGETYRHRHQIEKKGTDDKRGYRIQKGTGGKKQGGSAGGKGEGRK